MRFKKTDKVVAEINYWYQKEHRNFYFGNANSLAHGQLLEHIIDAVEEKQQYINIFLVGRPEDILRNEHVLEKIFKSRCIHLIGIETGIEANTQNLLNLLGRGLTPQSNQQAIELLLALKKNYSPSTLILANMILFSHFDMTIEDFKENVRFIGDYQCSRAVMNLQLYGLANTPIWEDMLQRGFKPNPRYGLQITQYPFSDKLVNLLFEKLVKRPMDTITKQKGYSLISHLNYQYTCHDKLLEFYYTPNMMDSILDYIGNGDR